jgi:guanylate cyclase
MVRQLGVKLLAAFGRIGADPRDTETVRLQKLVVVTANMVGSTFGVISIVAALINGDLFATATLLIWLTVTTVNVYVFARTRNFDRFRFVLFGIVLIMPAVTGLTLTGSNFEGAGVLWSFISPLMALIGTELRKATRWFLAYLAMVVVSWFLQPYVQSSNFEIDATQTFEFAFSLIGVPTMTFVLLRYFVNQRNIAMSLLAREQERSESLLLNILPEQVAETLKVESRTIAERFDEASVLFADLVGFTPLSAQMEPDETVELLNEIYSYLDSLAEKYDVEKIRTIGDNYMVAAGVPTPRPDHAQALARMALDIQAYAAGLSPQSGNRLEFRIGINSGPLVAGVIGKKKFHYDVWGDTVNTASRMESQGEPGKIQITQATRDLLGDAFVSEARGAVDIKGKGEMRTWFLVDRA